MVCTDRHTHTHINYWCTFLQANQIHAEHKSQLEQLHRQYDKVQTKQTRDDKDDT